MVHKHQALEIFSICSVWAAEAAAVAESKRDKLNPLVKLLKSHSKIFTMAKNLKLKLRDTEFAQNVMVSVVLMQQQ